jgi:hypothetical protein
MYSLQRLCFVLCLGLQQQLRCRLRQAAVDYGCSVVVRQQREMQMDTGIRSMVAFCDRAFGSSGRLGPYRQQLFGSVLWWGVRLPRPYRLK